MAKKKKNKFFVGRQDGRKMGARISGLGRRVKRRSFSTMKKAEAFIEQISQHDAIGVWAGDYYLDGPERRYISCT